MWTENLKTVKNFADAKEFDVIGKPIEFRKRPIVIQAALIKEDIAIETLEGTMKGKAGSWLIRGVQGEVYACDAEIFEATYVKVD